MQTIKQILRQNIEIFEKDIDYKIINPGFEKNIIYEGVEMAAPLRQLITLIKFIYNLNSPHIVIRNVNSNIFAYNDEFSKFINYLLMSGIKINFYFDNKADYHKILNFDTSAFNDNLFIHNNKSDMNYWCKRLVDNLHYRKKDSIDINNTIFVCDENDKIDKILVLSKDFILITFESTLVESIHYLKLIQEY